MPLRTRRRGGTRGANFGVLVEYLHMGVRLDRGSARRAPHAKEEMQGRRRGTDARRVAKGHGNFFGS